jgi:hypothetical protein
VQSSTDAQALAAPLATLCSQDEAQARAAGADCERANQVAAGRNGADGRGVVGTSLTDGILVVTYSDGTSTKVGRVSGQDGQDGTAGAPGRGIATTTIENGRLIVLFTDGTRADHGPVVGPAGVGIASVAAVAGRLQVTLTDGRVIDVGPLPEGPAGRDGTNGKDAPLAQTITRVYTDGSTERCDRDQASDPITPRFICERTPATPAEEGPP